MKTRTGVETPLLSKSYQSYGTFSKKPNSKPPVINEQKNDDVISIPYSNIALSPMTSLGMETGFYMTQKWFELYRWLGYEEIKINSPKSK